jgi:mRNA-degrading endonuclease RelE of RelBE toxin-antitoxin system
LRVEFTSSAAREFSKLPPAVQRRFVDAIDGLVAGTRVDVKKLKGAKATWRLRVGDHRGIFEREGERAVFTRFSHRSKVYDV